MATSNTLPPELFQTFLLDNTDEKIQTTYKIKENRITFEKWFSTFKDALSWIKDNIPLSLRVLRVISKECEQEEFLAIQKIYDVFRNSLHFKAPENKEFNELIAGYLLRFSQSDRQGFENYLKSENDKGDTPLHVAALNGDIDFFIFVEHHFPDLFDQLLEKEDPALFTPLYVALNSKKLNVLKFVRERRPQIFVTFLETKCGKWERTPLLEAAASGYLDFFTFVHQNFSELYIRFSQVTGKGGLSCLHWAAYNRNHTICDYIQSSDPEIFNLLVKLKDASNLSPLHYAIMSLNSTFVKKVKLLVPSYFYSFFETSEPEIFKKILCGTTEKPKPLLTLMIQEEEIDLLELMLKKELDLCLEILLLKDFPGYPLPLRIAFENECTPILDILFRYAPALFDKLEDIPFVLSLVDAIEDNTPIFFPYCRQFPVTTALLQTLIFLEDNDYRNVRNLIQAHLARPHAQSYVEAIIQCDTITDYLNLQEDILTKYLDSLPDLNFISWEKGMDILVQLPPTEIKNTLDHMDKESIEEIMDIKTFVHGDTYVQGSSLSYWWILKDIFEQYGNSLNDEEYLTIARFELSSIIPKALAACCKSDETEAMVKTLLLAIPEPQYRVVIPLLSLEEHQNFINGIPLERQLHYIRISTAEQKLDFLDRFELVPLETLEVWVIELTIHIESINLDFKDPKSLDEMKIKFGVLKRTWFEGQHHCTFLIKQDAVLAQLFNTLTFYENTEDLHSLINSKLDPYIKRIKKLFKEIKDIRSEIWDSIANIPALKEVPIPDEFLCPISGEIMRNPVKDPYGQSYEEEQILTWLKENKTSPISRQPLTPSDLKPNLELKERIQKFQEQQDKFS